jgi:hypothetical protein
MDEDNVLVEGGSREPKIHIPVALLIGLAVLVLDLIDLIPIAGDLTDLPSLMVNFYLYTLGVSGVFFIIGEVIDLFPVAQEFPWRSIAWWITVGVDHFAPAPVAAVTEKIGEELQGGEGELEGDAAGAVEGAGGAQGTFGGGGGALIEEEGSVEFGAGGGEGGGESAEVSETARKEGKPSDRIETKDQEAVRESQEEGQRDEDETAEEEGEKEERETDEFATGSERSPEEEAEEEAFSPEELEFQEGRFDTRNSDSDETSDEEEARRKESEAEKTARKQQAKVIEIKDRFTKPKSQQDQIDEDKNLRKAA